MKVWIDADESCPVFTLSTKEKDGGSPVTVDELTLERWTRVLNEYEVVQNEMEKAV